MEEKIKEFERLLMVCNRPGMDSLLAYIRKSDFYTAPASTRFHGCHEGGLLEHSLNVYHCLATKLNNPTWAGVLGEVGAESMTIAALSHDICKCSFYCVEYKNKKIYNDHGSKQDSNGRYDWQTVPGFTIDDNFPFGHGEKSVFIISQFIKLKPIEAMAIRWHMGFTEPKENWNTLGTAIEKYPFILALHEADLEATYLLEKKE